MPAATCAGLPAPPVGYVWERGAVHCQDHDGCDRAVPIHNYTP